MEYSEEVKKEIVNILSDLLTLEKLDPKLILVYYDKILWTYCPHCLTRQYHQYLGTVENIRNNLGWICDECKQVNPLIKISFKFNIEGVINEAQSSILEEAETN